MLSSHKVTGSMSRDETSTDNPVIISKNSCIKKMHIDFEKNNYTTVQEVIDDIVLDNNYFKTSYALYHKTPIEFKNQLGSK